MEMLRQLRIENGLTQEQLAKEIGVSDATINMYEKGLRKPKYDKIFKLAVALKVESRILIADVYGVQILMADIYEDSAEVENVTIPNSEYKYLKEIEEKYNAIKTLVR